MELTKPCTQPRLLARCLYLIAIACAVLGSAPGARHAYAAAEKLLVCATVPDLASIVRSIGGDAVEVRCFVRGPEDPHFLEAKPSFIKALSKADLFVHVGLELEAGWVPALLDQCRNGAVLPGALGNLDASRAVTILEIPAGTIDRSWGDVHPYGNPHYLLDPVQGWRVAHAVCARLKELAPDRAGAFDKSYADFAQELTSALFGTEFVARVGMQPIWDAVAGNELDKLVAAQSGSIGGWFAQLRAARDAAVVADHNLWPYFAARFGLKIVGFLEPKPGIAPTTRHLQALIAQMQSLKARLVLTVPYFDPKHAEFVARHTDAKVVKLAHQCGALDGTAEYVAMIAANVRAVAAALGQKGG
ncbi:MAG: metal ABC transporter substrate-binding protein [Planctomycetes bacterium]|nr:metal ABC transporter substrate-binding protein [Planctomycetota bacterium]